jgi:ADP-L-glycero-D-manno-heptose 6-epimerase
MHFIVTGGAGFIGSNLVRELQRRHPNAWLSVVDDFSSGAWQNLVDFRGDVLALPCETLDWERTFGQAEVSGVYHLASITDTTVQDQRLMVERNVEGFRRVLDFAARRGVPVTYASSAATYGLVEGAAVEEQTPEPANVYGFSKMVLDNLARRAAAGGLTVAGVRYFNVYGPGEAHKGKMASMVYQLYRQMQEGRRPRIFTDGHQQRDFVYVRDAVAGTIAAMDSGRSGAYNIGSGTARSFNELVIVLNRTLSTNLPPDYIDNPYIGAYQNFTLADLKRSKDELGYAPEWPLERGVEHYVEVLQGEVAVRG